MTQTAIVFPGQGSQYLGMLKDYYQRFETVRLSFDEAGEALGYDLWQTIQNDEKKLNQTACTQPALLAASVAIWRVLSEHGLRKPNRLAGHSLGEYSALVCAKSLAFPDALRLVRKRGELMQSAVTDTPCAMSAILALSNEAVIECCEEAQKYGVVEPANFNSIGQIVISGEKKAVEKANEIAKGKGAKRAQLLAVSVPSHCILMKPAAERFAAVLDEIGFQTPEIPILHNVDIQTHSSADGIKKALVKQLYSPVLWTQTIEKIAETGIEQVLECGAGKVLTSLNKRITKAMTYSDTSSVEMLEKFTTLNA